MGVVVKWGRWILLGKSKKTKIGYKWGRWILLKRKGEIHGSIRKIKS